MEDRSLQEFRVISKHRMINQYYPKLRACIEIICYDELWEKPTEKTNSIGEITLHIVEHIQRSTVRLFDPERRFPAGIENHFPRTAGGKSEVLHTVERVFNHFERAMDEAAAAHISLRDIYHLIEHTAYHLGQIVDRTQALTNHQFQFVQNGLSERTLKNLITEELNPRER